MAVPKKYAHINFKPTQAMARNAERGLRYRQEAGGGGLTPQEAGRQNIGSGVSRAVQLKYRRNVSPDTVRRMVAFFARHERNARVAPGKDPSKDKGFISWLLWGGDEGFAWARRIVRAMDKADKG